MKTVYALALLALAAGPATACPGPRPPGTEPAIPLNGATTFNANPSFDLTAADCARITDWYRRHGWVGGSPPPAHHPAFGRAHGRER